MCGWLHFPALRPEGVRADMGQARVVASKAFPSRPVLTAGNLACWPFSCSAAGEGVWSWPLTPQLVLSSKRNQFLQSVLRKSHRIAGVGLQAGKTSNVWYDVFYQQTGLWTCYIHRQPHMCLVEIKIREHFLNFEVTACLVWFKFNRIGEKEQFFKAYFMG